MFLLIISISWKRKTTFALIYTYTANAKLPFSCCQQCGSAICRDNISLKKNSHPFEWSVQPINYDCGLQLTLEPSWGAVRLWVERLKCDSVSWSEADWSAAAHSSLSDRWNCPAGMVMTWPLHQRFLLGLIYTTQRGWNVHEYPLATTHWHACPGWSHTFNTSIIALPHLLLMLFNGFESRKCSFSWFPVHLECKYAARCY